MKLCKFCNTEKDFSEFSPKANGKLVSRCKSCVNEYNKEYRARYSKSKWDRVYERRKNNQKKNTEKLFDYLCENHCVDCGEDNPLVLEFDHLDRENKSFNISSMMRHSWVSILAEIKKCRVLCANCHRKRTAIQFNWYMLELFRQRSVNGEHGGL